MLTGDERRASAVTILRKYLDAYRKVFGEFLEQYRQPCAEMNIDYRLVRTDQEAALFVRSFLEERKRLSK